MTIEKVKQGNDLILAVEGRIDTTTAPELQDPLLDALGDSAKVVLDLQKVAYISSAGLRVLMMGQKYAGEHKKAMALKNVSEDIMEVFEMTGFTDILTFE